MRSFSPRQRRIQRTPLPWPYGKDGPLHINGTTVYIEAASVKDYSLISIRNSGVLLITDVGGGDPTNWTIIGCAGNIIIDSTSRIDGGYCATYQGTVTTRAPNGRALSHTFGYGYGAAGGYDEDYENDPGEDDGWGNGGGGSTNLPGEWSTEFASGAGANGTLEELYGSEAFGGAAVSINTSGAAGEYGTPFYPTTEYPGDGRGGAGSGGVRGWNGHPLYICCRGIITSAHPLGIRTPGWNGGEGSYGGDTNGNFTGNPYTGGGGGPGGGGNGGSLIIDAKYNVNTTWAVNKTGTYGGSGGDPGFGGSGSTDYGQNGTDGTKIITCFNN
jgi:hypothetical protein